MARFYCSLCVFNTSIFKSFNTHCKRIHGNEKNFRMYCSVQQCPYSSRNARLFWLHMKRNHPIQHINAAEMSSDDDQDKIPGDTPGDDTLSVQDRQDFLAAKFSISLETEHKLSQQGTDDVIHSTKLLFDETFSLFQTKLAEKMRTRGITTDVLDDVSNPDVLCHLSSQNSRNAFYSSCMNLIKPRDVLLYREFTLREGVKNHLGYLIPFAENLKSLLSLPEIWREIGNSHKSRDKYMHDISDEGFVQNSEIFNAHPHALQILLYTDDIEIVNTIGSHTSKHKLSMFYFTLANISPQYRSTLSAIQLLRNSTTGFGQPNENFLYACDDVKIKIRGLLSQTYPTLRDTFMRLLGNEHGLEPLVYFAKVVNIHGHKYQPGCVLVTGYDDDNMPQIAQVIDIFVHDDIKYFIVEILGVVNYDDHFMSFAIQSCHETRLMRYSDMFNIWPQSLYRTADQIYFVNRYSHTCEFPWKK